MKDTLSTGAARSMYTSPSVCLRTNTTGSTWFAVGSVGGLSPCAKAPVPLLASGGFSNIDRGGDRRGVCVLPPGRGSVEVSSLVADLIVVD